MAVTSLGRGFHSSSSRSGLEEPRLRVPPCRGLRHYRPQRGRGARDIRGAHAPAVLLLGFLSFRLTRNLVVAGAVTALAGLSPWLFEVSRLVFEVTALPLLVVLLLLAVERIAGRATWRIRDGALVGLPLVAILFSYAAGRILAPLFAACLFVFVRRERIRGLVAALAVLGSGFALIGVYAVSHPGALSARAQAVSFIGEEPWATALWHAVRNYGVDINPVWWLLHGDSNARHHVPGAPALFVPLVAAAIAGLALVLLERRRDPWWQFVLAGTLAAPIPAAVTGGPASRASARRAAGLHGRSRSSCRRTRRRRRPCRWCRRSRGRRSGRARALRSAGALCEHVSNGGSRSACCIRGGA